MKSFKRLFSAPVINSLVTYRKNIGQEVDHLHFRTDVVTGFLVKYAILSGYHDSDQAETRLTKGHFPRKPPHKSQVNHYAGVSSTASMIQDESLYQCWDSDTALCQWTFQSLPYKEILLTSCHMHIHLLSVENHQSKLYLYTRNWDVILNQNLCNLQLKLSSIALNTVPALHYILRCVSPHLEQIEMLLIHSFMLDSSTANTMFHWYCSVTMVYSYQETWPTTWLLLFLRKKYDLQFCHFQIKHKTIVSTDSGTNLRNVVMPHPYLHINVF
jgi:hypothetical protein